FAQRDLVRDGVGDRAVRGDVVPVSGGLNRDRLAAAEDPGAGDGHRCCGAQVQRVAGARPGEHRGFQLVAGCPGNGSPRRLVHGPVRTRAVHGDALPVGGQPPAHAVQGASRCGGYRAGAVRADVEQVVATARGDTEQVTGQGRGRLPVGVVAGETPVAVDGHAALPQLAVDRCGRDRLFGGTEVAVVDASLADPVVHYQVRVQPVQIVLQVLAVSGRPGVGRVGRCPLAVEPQDRRVVAGDQLLELGVHVDLVLREVVDEVRVVPVPDRVVQAVLDPRRVGSRLHLGQDVAALGE